jgi:hypothetical protein
MDVLPSAMLEMSGLLKTFAGIEGVLHEARSHGGLLKSSVNCVAYGAGILEVREGALLGDEAEEISLPCCDIHHFHPDYDRCYISALVEIELFLELWDVICMIWERLPSR